MGVDGCIVVEYQRWLLPYPTSKAYLHIKLNTISDGKIVYVHTKVNKHQDNVPVGARRLVPYKTSRTTEQTITNTEEFQWLKHLWSHENMFEAGVIQANEC